METMSSYRGFRRKVSSLTSRARSLLNSQKEEKRRIKALIGVTSGILIGMFVFLVYRYSFGYTFSEAGILSIIFTVLICVGLALSSFVRCIIALVVPNFFTGVGRTVLLSAIFALILNHPISNISYNARNTVHTMACVVEIAVNQTLELQREMAINLHDLKNYVMKQNKELKDVVDKLDSKFDNINTILDQLEDGSMPIEEVSYGFQKNCEERFNSLEKTCKNLTQKAVRSAELNNPLASLDTLCGTVTDIFNDGELCPHINVSSSCYLGVDLKLIKKEIRSKLEEAIKYFNADMVILAEDRGNANISKPATLNHTKWEEDITRKIEVFVSVVSVIRKCVSLSLLLIFLQSFWYLRNYLTNDGYDNIYITKQFEEMDNEAKKNGSESVLPLTKLESDKYVNSLSFKLNSTELAYSKLGLIQVLLHFLFWLLVITFDYTLYNILSMVQEYGNIEIKMNTSSEVTIAVNGDGIMAEFYKILVNPYNLHNRVSKTHVIEPCLPHPQEPSSSTIPVFVILYIIALAIVLLRAYGMRLRRKVSAYYCPEQELARLDYLHKKIRHRRVEFLTFLRQQIKSAHKEEQVKNQLRFSSWLAFNFPFIAQILPKKEKLECTSCGQRDTSFNKIQLTKCTGEKGGIECGAVYCEECFTVLHETCPLCSTNENVAFRY